MKKVSLLLATMIGTGYASDARAADAVLKVPNLQSPLPMAQVRDISGYVGQRLQANTQGYVKKFDIDRYVRLMEDKKPRDWWWIGEQPGKWVESAVLSSQESGDQALATQARQILKRIEASQDANGYVGITPASMRTPAHPVYGLDPYEMSWTLHGLLTAHEELGDDAALATARRMGDYIVNTIGPGKAEFWPSDLRPPENHEKVLDGHSAIAGHSAHYGWEGTLLINPMLRLYQATGDPKYAEWGLWVVANIDKWSGWDAFSKLDQVADGTLGIDAVQPYVHAHTFQMNFLGFLRLYQITGDASLLRKVQGAWKDVAHRQMYITGGVSVGEHYEKGFNRPLTGNVVETCATMTWMELTQALLDLTNDPHYADAMERLLLNHVFASQTIDGDCYRYHTPPNGFKPEGFFHGPDCCTSSGQRLASLLPKFFYGQGPGGLFVNQFVASKATFKLDNGTSVALEQKTNYPETETVELSIAPDKPATFALNVRLPGWCEKPALKINGQAVQGLKAGTYARLQRQWKRGDTVLLSLPMTVRWVEHDHFADVTLHGVPGAEAVFERANGSVTAPWAFTRGPVVYALDTVWWNDPKVPAPREVAQEAGIVRTATPKPVAAPSRALGPAYEVPIRLTNGATVQARMLPFTNIGQWYQEGEARPDPNSRTFSYAIWLQDSAGAGFARLAGAQKQQNDLLKSSIDWVNIGDETSEREHQLKSEGSTSGVFRDHHWRDARNGWFSYEVKVPTEQASDLVVTYWGGETDLRLFDIWVNDTKVATQKLQQDKPEAFFEVRYKIPFELIQNKTDAFGQKIDHVTVKFQAQPGSIAGGVLGLRVEKRRAD